MKLTLGGAFIAVLAASSAVTVEAFTPLVLQRQSAHPFGLSTQIAHPPKLQVANTALFSTVGSVDTKGVPLRRKTRPPYIPGEIPDPDYVRIFDTTLRDGEQSPGATLTSQEKLEIARMLAKLGVDVIEAGFPIASPDDFSAVKDIADKVGNEVFEDGYVPAICGLSRANAQDIERAWDAVKGAKYPRIHTFIATSKFIWRPN